MPSHTGRSGSDRCCVVHEKLKHPTFNKAYSTEEGKRPKYGHIWPEYWLPEHALQVLLGHWEFPPQAAWLLDIHATEHRHPSEHTGRTFSL